MDIVLPKGIRQPNREQHVKTEITKCKCKCGNDCECKCENCKRDQTRPKIEDLQWAVKSRYENQKCAIKLYKLLEEYEDKDKWSAKHFSLIARFLVGVAFSLWRAAFLADKTDGKKKESRRKARAFLEKVIQTNSIGFPDDRTHREWTYDYYIENAYFRLDYLFRTTLLMDRRPKHFRKAIATGDWRDLWDDYHVCLSSSVDRFEQALKSKNSPFKVRVLQALRASTR